jgi:hypothetical protein
MANEKRPGTSCGDDVGTMTGSKQKAQKQAMKSNTTTSCGGLFVLMMFGFVAAVAAGATAVTQLFT